MSLSHDGGRLLRRELARDAPLLLPVAHDALSARLIEMAGFRGYCFGGFPVSGAQHSLPDLGLLGFGELKLSLAAMLDASTLPIVVDADDGYGAQHNVARTVRTYEDLGAAAIVIEDQAWPKRCGHLAGKSVIERSAWLDKLHTALATRRNAATLVIARTDARAVDDLDEALRRGEEAVAAGVDGVFIEAPRTRDELVEIGRSLPGTPKLANMLEGGQTPILPADELHALGFAMVAFPVSLLFRVVEAMQQALAALRLGNLADLPPTLSMQQYMQVVKLDHWTSFSTQKAEAHKAP